MTGRGWGCRAEDRLRDLIRIPVPQADVVVQDPEAALPGEPFRIYVCGDGWVGKPDGE